MKREEFKKVVSVFLKRRMAEWFPDKPFIKGLGISLIDAQINKYDTLIELFENEEGEIDLEGIIENMGDIIEPIKIDLRQYSPMLPNRTVMITKSDINELLSDAYQGKTR